MKVISLGLGVQSTALYYMSSIGELPRCDYAVFADPGREMKYTMEYIDYIETWRKKNNGIPIIYVNKKNLFKDLLNKTNSANQRLASIPAFTIDKEGKKGMMRRQCTNEYKLMQVNKAIKEIYGLDKHARYPETDMWVGITSDEAHRMTIPREKWKVMVYPFCGYSVYADGRTLKFEEQKFIKNRTRVIQWLDNNGLKNPGKSTCIFCPYHSDANWLHMKINYPEDFADCIRVDEAIRDSYKRGILQPIYLHESCKPLRDVQFDESQTTMHGNCSVDCHI